MPNAVSVFLNALYSFVALFIVTKFLGKKQIAQLSFTDYVVGISIGSIAAEWSTDVVNPSLKVKYDDIDETDDEDCEISGSVLFDDGKLDDD